MKVKFSLTVLLVVTLTFYLRAQTSLSSGDIAIIWNQTDNPDAFAFVSFVDMDAGTVIYFTDCGADESGFNTPCTEGALKYTVPSGGLFAGDIITLGDNASDFTSYTDTRIIGSMATSVSGDQIIAFQDASNPEGSIDAANNPLFIFASSTASTLFEGDKTNTNESGLPPGLVDTGLPRTALGLGAGSDPDDEVDNSVYNGSYDFSSGGIPEAKIALTNPENYYASNSNPPGLDTVYDDFVTAIPTALTLSGTLSNKNISLIDSIRLFPNPSKGSFVIKNTGYLIQNVEIYNVQGSVLKTFDFREVTDDIIINLDFESGLYFVKTYSVDNSVFVNKLIIK